MRLPVALAFLFSACAWLAPTASLAQEVAGRMLVAIGDVTIVRGTQRMPARSNAEVLPGDTIELGAQANAQIRLTDESIIALRPGTTFRISEYAFRGRAPEEQSAFFNLVKGGMRTVTGLIGKVRNDRYRVQTPTATVGIRGTHYTIVHCDNDCATPGQSADTGGTLLASADMLAQSDAGSGGAAGGAANGSYGWVTSDTITVTNQTGTKEFGKDQVFFVASQSAPAQPLPFPPAFMSGSVAPPPTAGTPKPPASGEAAAPGKPAAGAPAGQASAPPPVAYSGEFGGNGGGVGIAESTAKVIQTSTVVAATSENSAGSTSVAPPVFLPNEAATAQGPSAVLQPGFTGTVFYRVSGPFNIPVACSDGPCSAFVTGDITLGVNFTLQRAGMSINLKDAEGGIINAGTPFTSQGLPVTVENGQVKFGGTFNLADNPTNTGAFRCSNCGPSDGLGFLSSFTINGTISGSTASVNITGTVFDGATGTFSASLASATPPNNDVAAIVVPVLGGGANARSASFWGVQLDAQRKLVDFGPEVGQVRANVGSATNTIAGSAPSAGNLVWGAWNGAGAQVTDFNYNTFVTGGSAFVPWITGTATNTLPQSLGTLTYTPVGGMINNGFATLHGGSITADFVNRTMSLHLDVSRTSGELNRFVMNGGSGFSSTTGRFSAGFTSVTCSGPCTSGGNQPGGSFGGFFAGQQAEGAGTAFTAGFGTGNGVSGVVGFKR